MFPGVATCILVGFTLLCPFTSFSQRDWTSRRHKDGVEVFVKSVNGADIKSYKAVSSTSASIEKCVSFLLDFENHIKWRYSVSKVEVLRSQGDELICYMVLDVPWPADDRDVVIQITKNYISDNKVQVVLTAIEGVKEKVDGFIRVTNSITKWTFDRVGDRTNIIYEGSADPGGTLPGWLINVGVVDAPFETLRNFVDLVED